MGLRGPKPESNIIKLLRGNPGRRPIDVSKGPSMEASIPLAPDHLSQEAKKEWRRIIPDLVAAGLLSRLDRAALAIYCQSWGRLVLAEKALSARQRSAIESGEDEAEAVLTQTTPTGFMRESAMFSAVCKLQADCSRYLASFGMSPASRSAVTAFSTNQGVEKEDAWASL